MNKKIKIGIAILLVLIVYLIYSGITSPNGTKSSYKINILEEPVQGNKNLIKKFSLKNEVTITPVATYSVSAKILGRKNYSFDETAEYSPTDLILAWGKLTEPEYKKKVSYSQGNRWYYFSIKDASLGADFVSTQSANTHIIPKNINIERAVKALKNNQTVYLEGYLANVNVNGKIYTTSTDREDVGAGSCEIFYVTKVITKGYQYD